MRQGPPLRLLTFPPASPARATTQRLVQKIEGLQRRDPDAERLLEDVVDEVIRRLNSPRDREPA